MLSELCRNILIITHYEYEYLASSQFANVPADVSISPCCWWEVNEVENYLMVAEDGHLSVSSVIGQHLGGNIVVWVCQLVQLLLQCVGGIVCPGMGNIKR